MGDLVVIQNDYSFTPLVNMVIDGLTSEHSKDAYKRALTGFLDWYKSSGQGEFNKASVLAYKARLVDSGLKPSTVNQRLSAIRKLATEANDNGILAADLASGIAKIKGVRMHGTRSGNWLSKERAQEVINSPDVTTLKGLRDRAILAILLGCGLRRSECASLQVGDIQQREGRWVIVDMTGKGRRVRSVPMPTWTKAAIDSWTARAGITTGNIFRQVRRGDHLTGIKSMTAHAIHDVVKTYAGEAAPHDLRRTFAKLCHKGGAALEQIQLTLGHSTIQTTERYLGIQQDLTDAPCDKLGLK